MLTWRDLKDAMSRYTHDFDLDKPVIVLSDDKVLQIKTLDYVNLDNNDRSPILIVSNDQKNVPNITKDSLKDVYDCWF